MKIPYTQLELQFALLGLERKFDKHPELLEKMDEIVPEKIMPEVLSKKALNEAIAADNGISVDALIASVNYETLKTEYMNKKGEQFIAALVSVGFTNIEACALVSAASGSLEV
jgi:hypothetical protein